jgi:hypothetical protein
MRYRHFIGIITARYRHLSGYQQYADSAFSCLWVESGFLEVANAAENFRRSSSERLTSELPDLQSTPSAGAL